MGFLRNSFCLFLGEIFGGEDRHSVEVVKRRTTVRSDLKSNIRIFRKCIFIVTDPKNNFGYSQYPLKYNNASKYVKSSVKCVACFLRILEVKVRILLGKRKDKGAGTYWSFCNCFNDGYNCLLDWD